MSDFGFKRESFSSFPDLYPSPEKQAQFAMEESSFDDEEEATSAQAVDAPEDESSSPDETSTRPEAAPLPGHLDTTSSISATSSAIPITINFQYSESNRYKEDINGWQPVQRTIGVSASESDFSNTLRDALLERTASESDLISRLRQSEQKIHMLPLIRFNDWRDRYLKPDVCGTFNFEQVKDLFFRPSDLMHINVTVHVTIRPRSTEADTFLNPNRDVYIPFGYDVDRSQDYRASHGMSLERYRAVYLARCRNGTAHNVELVKVESWLVDGQHTGDPRSSQVLQEFPKSRVTFRNFTQQTRSELEAAIRDFMKEPSELLRKKLEYFSRNTPSVPKFSFQPLMSAYESSLGSIETPLAIRFVKQYFGGDERLESLPLRWLKAAADAVPGFMYENLCEVLKTLLFTRNAHDIFTTRTRDEWSLDLWVVPQGEKKARFWWHGPLTQFMKEEFVRGEDYRLYLEAHIVPVRRPYDDNVFTTEVRLAVQSDLDEPSLSGKTGRLHTKFIFNDGRKPWPPAERAIPLDTTLSELVDVINEQSETSYFADTALLRAMEETDKHLEISIKIAPMATDGTEKSVREEYEHCRSRALQLRDLFDKRDYVKGKNPTVIVEVRIDVVDGISTATKLFANHPPYRYHRYGTMVMPGAGPSTHLPMEIALLANYDPSNPSSWDPVQVPFRRINGILIGASRVESDTAYERFPADFEPTTPYQGVLSHHWDEFVNLYLQDLITKNITQRSHDGTPELDVPMLPNISLIPFHANEATRLPHNTDIDDIDLAVRVVNCLHDIGGEDIPLPRNILMTVKKPRTETFEVVDNAFHEKLEDFCTTHTIAGNAKRHPAQLLTDLKDKWTAYFWVMPQHENMQKLKAFKKGGGGKPELQQYLDKKMALRGDTKLYMEVHLVPK